MLDKCAPDVGAAWALTQFRSGACKVTPVTAPITLQACLNPAGIRGRPAQSNETKLCITGLGFSWDVVCLHMVSVDCICTVEPLVTSTTKATVLALCSD